MRHSVALCGGNTSSPRFRALRTPMACTALRCGRQPSIVLRSYYLAQG